MIHGSILLLPIVLSTVYQCFWHRLTARPWQPQHWCFLGFGNGSFVDHTTIPTGAARPIWIHITHINNDTHLDLVTADYGTDSISLFAGDDTGNFSYQIRYSTGYDSSPLFLVSDDFNSDYQTDLVVADSGTGNMSVIFGTMNGKFSEQKIFPISM